jgi:hypothetical protein
MNSILTSTLLNLQTNEDYLFDSNGYVYKSIISVDTKTFKILFYEIKKEIPQEFPRLKEYTFDSFHKTSFLKELTLNNNISFLNNTQLSFINLFLGLKLYNNNTCLKIIK